ncbi:MAG: hypothetical protein RPR97_09785 [Colwellia sp.]
MFLTVYLMLCYCQKVAEQALASGSPENNPIEPSINEIITIYQGLWD